MEEVKIHSGTRVKLKRVDEDVLPTEFVSRLKDLAHKDERILALYFFAIQAEEQAEQPSMAIALKAPLFGSSDESFLHVVEEIQMLLPEDLAINLYRFGTSDFLARHCVENLEPVYLRSTSWLDKQRKKYLRG